MVQNPRKNHRYLYIDKNGNYVYPEDVATAGKNRNGGVDYSLNQNRVMSTERRAVSSNNLNVSRRNQTNSGAVNLNNGSSSRTQVDRKTGNKPPLNGSRTTQQFREEHFGAQPASGNTKPNLPGLPKGSSAPRNSKNTKANEVAVGTNGETGTKLTAKDTLNKAARAEKEAAKKRNAQNAAIDRNKRVNAEEKAAGEKRAAQNAAIDKARNGDNKSTLKKVVDAVTGAATKAAGAVKNAATNAKVKYSEKAAAKERNAKVNSINAAKENYKTSTTPSGTKASHEVNKNFGTWTKVKAGVSNAARTIKKGSKESASTKFNASRNSAPTSNPQKSATRVDKTFSTGDKVKAGIKKAVRTVKKGTKKRAASKW